MADEVKGALRLPEPLRPLARLALDLRWTWSHAGDALWRLVDEELWEQTSSPWLMLQLLSGSRLEALASDPAFLAQIQAAEEERARHLDSPKWFDLREAGPVGLVAYFSMEFGLHESLPLYAGGLGILAGDHLKTASDLGAPLVGIGILWQQGYFRQVIDAGGGQREFYPHNDPGNLPLQPLRNGSGDPVEVALELPGRRIRLRSWVAEVGGVKLLLLDANHPLNAAPDRGITATLYSPDAETRLLQELILGIGGWRLLQEAGYSPDVCHMNEGHAAFVVLERARGVMRKHGVSFREALWATRAGNVFTTHTSVPAGFDSFGRPIIDKYRPYFTEYVQGLGITWPELLALGRRNAEDPDEPFSMAYLALRGAAQVNGVSRRHGAVSRELFQPLFPRVPEAEVPVSHVTNGVHVPSWDSVEADAFWTAAAGKERWRRELDGLIEGVRSRTDEELWELRSRNRDALVRRSRARLHLQLGQRGLTGVPSEEGGPILDPLVLTVGFARRFTSYKRPNLLLCDPPRLRRILTDSARPIQLIVAGKAHPADAEGKRLIREWVEFAGDARIRHRVVFLEDYDMALARELVEGVDVWLNTPRPPWEACGTSGMKVLVNGGLNLSALDGWWMEAYEPGNGWAFSEPGGPPGTGSDAAAAAELYRLLEEDVVPLFYTRDATGLPRGWLQYVRTSMAQLTPRFSSNRMTRQYVEEFYVPATREVRERSAAGLALGRELAAWESRILASWGAVRFQAVDLEVESGKLRASALVALGELATSDVAVELYAEPTRSENRLRERMTVEPPGAENGDLQRYTLRLSTDRPAGDFTARIVPFHPKAVLPLELPAIRWQR